MAKSILEKLKGISDVQKNGDQKQLEQQFQSLITDLDKKLDASAKEGNRSLVIYESDDPKDFQWSGVDGKGQQTKIFLARRLKGLLAKIHQHCKEQELDPEVEFCTKCKNARVVIRW